MGRYCTRYCCCCVSLPILPAAVLLLLRSAGETVYSVYDTYLVPQRALLFKRDARYIPYLVQLKVLGCSTYVELQLHPFLDHPAVSHTSYAQVQRSVSTAMYPGRYDMILQYSTTAVLRRIIHTRMYDMIRRLCV